MIEEVYITTEGKELGYMKLSYNYQGQIETVTKETGKAAEYAYNTKRERIHKRIYNGNQTEDIFYIWDAGGRIIAEENATKGETVKYIYGGNEKLAMVRVNEKTGKEEIYYYLNNLQGTPEAIIDGSRQIVQRIQLDEWGRIEKIMGKFQDEITFTGKKLDPETGFYYFNQRYYDPELMRFVSKDPAEQTLNPYLYTGSSPLVYVDPNGEFFFSAILSIFGPVGTTIGGVIDTAIAGAATSAAYNALGQQIFNGHIDWFSVGEAAKGGAYGNTVFKALKIDLGESWYLNAVEKGISFGVGNVINGMASGQHMSVPNTFDMFENGFGSGAASYLGERLIDGTHLTFFKEYGLGKAEIEALISGDVKGYVLARKTKSGVFEHFQLFFRDGKGDLDNYGILGKGNRFFGPAEVGDEDISDFNYRKIRVLNQREINRMKNNIDSNAKYWYVLPFNNCVHACSL